MAADKDRVIVEATFTSTPSTVLRTYGVANRRVTMARYAVTIAVLAYAAVIRSLPMAILGIALPMLGQLSMRRRLGPYLKGNRDVTVTITDSEYRISSPGDRPTARPWSSIQSVRSSGDFWVLRVSAVAAMAFPKSALSAPQTERFVALMRAKGLSE